MPAKLTTTVSKIAQVPNKTNSAIIEEFYRYMKTRGSSEQHQNNILKTIIAYANFLGPETTFLDIQQKSQITVFLDTKVKPPEQDPERKWITTYNHYLRRIKQFFRWLYNQRGKDDIDEDSSLRWYNVAQTMASDTLSQPILKIIRLREKRIMVKSNDLVSSLEYEFQACLAC